MERRALRAGVNVTFLPRGWADYLHWSHADPKVFDRINVLVEEMRRSPFQGVGKPEPLREKLSDWWSRRITEEHRLVYRVTGKGDAQQIEIAQCRLHYAR